MATTKKAGAKKKVAKKASTPAKKKAAAPAKKKAAAPAKKKAAAPAKKKAAASAKKKAATPAKKKAPATKKTAAAKKAAPKPRKIEKPKIEKPKIEKPKVEEPKVEKPKVVKAAANEDLPRAPTAYRVDFRGRHIWPTVVVGEHAFAGEPGRSPLCEAGKPLLVAYERRAEDLHARGAIASVVLGYHVPGAEPRMQPMTSSQARIDVPVNAEGELELWFKLTMTDGRVLWDSDFGRNHRVEIVPAGEIWALFEGERSA